MKDKETKRKEGEARNTAWASLTPAQKLASLDGRLGKGVGARRQRERLDTGLNNPGARLTGVEA